MNDDALLEGVVEDGARVRQVHSASVPKSCSALFWTVREHQTGEDLVSSGSDQGAIRKPPVGEAIDDMLGISSRRPDVQRVNAFLSFSTDDHCSASAFDQEMSAAFANLELLGQPLTSTYDKDWQRRCNEKLQDCAFLICLVGETTYRSAAVAWEIGRAIELAKPVLPVVLHACTKRLMPILRENSIFPYSAGLCLTHSSVCLRVSELTK